MSEIKVNTDGFSCVSNAFVYDLDESLIASGLPMRTNTPDYSVGAGEKDVQRVHRLVEATKDGNTAHGQALTSIRVNFDLTCSNKMWVEAERYRFLEFCSSQSTMHRICKFDLDKCYNKYVDPQIIDIMKHLIDDYNYWCDNEEELVTSGECTKDEYDKIKKEKYLKVLYSNPAGFTLTARMTTNYRALRAIYIQRRDHRLPEWREFCRWIETLPYAEEFLTNI